MDKLPPPPRTIGYGNDDKIEALSFFFGSPNAPEKLRDYNQNMHAITEHFPDAFAGKSTKLMTTLNNLVLKAPDEWHTQVCLPFVQIEGTTVEWDESHYDIRIMQRTPVR